MFLASRSSWFCRKGQRSENVAVVVVVVDGRVTIFHKYTGILLGATRAREKMSERGQRGKKERKREGESKEEEERQLDARVKHVTIFTPS